MPLSEDMMLPENISQIQRLSKENQENIELLRKELNSLKDKLGKDMEDMENGIDEDNKLRDNAINDIRDNLALLKSFVNEKLTNHPDDYYDYIDHLGSSDDSELNQFEGGRRRKRKNTRKKNKRKSKRKSRRKYK